MSGFSLPTLNNQFCFDISDDFVHKDIEERYIKLLKEQRRPFKSVIDYINSTILDITFPSIAFPTAEQTTRLGQKIVWKGDEPIYNLLDKKGTITFQSVDSNLNYLIIMDCLIRNYLDTSLVHDPSLVMVMVDQNRKALYFMQYSGVVFTGQEGNKFAYNDQQVSSKTFTIDFVYNFFSPEFVYDKIDIIMNQGYTGHDLAKEIGNSGVSN